MARKVKDNRLDTRTARRELAAGNTDYWRSLQSKLHLGYRKRRADSAGVWIVRRYTGQDADGVGRYEKKRLGTADDYRDAGADVLSYAEAQRAAFAYNDAMAAEEARADAPAAVPTVADAVEDYLKFLALYRKASGEADRRARVFILPELGDLRLDQLTLRRLEAWRDALVAQPARVRTKAGQAQRYREPPATEEARRARRSTVNRTATVLKAALNRAARGTDIDDRAWRLLKPVGDAHSARPGHLSVAESQRLVNAADAASGFRDLVSAALLTGCRYGELCHLRVGDWKDGRLTIRESKSGKPRDLLLRDEPEAAAFFEARTAGRPAAAHIFVRPDGAPWAKNHQSRPMLAACAAGKISPPVGFHQLRHTWASQALMGGLPLKMIAERLGHATTHMVEKHYGHLSDDYRSEMMARYAPRFGIVPLPTNVASLDAARKGRGAR